MPNFNSPEGRRTFAAPRKALLTISDESQHLTADEIEASQIEYQELQAQRKDVISSSKRITPSSKERMEILLNLGRFTKEVEVDGITFSLRSLNSKEVQVITRMGETIANRIDAYFSSRNNVLSRSIYAIGGASLEDVLGTSDSTTVLKWLDDMDDTILEYLHNEYLEMVKKNRKRFEVKTDEQVKEVVEELKKS